MPVQNFIFPILFLHIPFAGSGSDDRVKWPGQQCLRLLVQVKCHIFSRPRAGIRLIRLSQRFVPQSVGNFVSGHFILYSIALNFSSKAFLQTPPSGHPENFIDFLSFLYDNICGRYLFYDSDL